MAEAKTMVIKVDLSCSKCYKKVKKILCEIPQIQDQVYDEKQNTVTIKVACCCSPEKIMQKIRCKGGRSIISIEIKPPKKKNKEKKDGDKPNPSDGEKEDGDKPNPSDGEKKDGDKQKPPDEQPADPNPKVIIKLPTHPPPKIPVLGYPQGYAYPVPFGVCCRQCSEGRRGGPCEQLAYGIPPCYGGSYGRPVCDSLGCRCDCGCNRGYYCRNRCGYYYYCEEPCSIM